jgi:hypothetical protein
VQQVEQVTPVRIGECLEYRVHTLSYAGNYLHVKARAALAARGYRPSSNSGGCRKVLADAGVGPAGLATLSGGRSRSMGLRYSKIPGVAKYGR